MNAVDRAFQTQLTNIQAKSGKTLAQLRAAIAKLGLTKHGELVARIKADYGLGHGDANTLAHYVRDPARFEVSAAPTDSAVDQIYAGPKAELRPIHDAVMAKVLAFGSLEIAPKKVYLSLRRDQQFAMIGPATRTRIDLGLNLKGVEGTKRFVAQPAKGMCQFKVGLTTLGDIDAELIQWLKRAYDAAGKN